MTTVFDHAHISASPTAGLDADCAVVSVPPGEYPPHAAAAPLLALEAVRLAAAPGEDASQVGDLNLTCTASQVLRVRGLNDADRRAFLRLLGGAAEPAQGRYRLAGKDLWSLPPPQRVAARLRCTGASLRSTRLFPHLTAQENVALSRLVNDLSSTDAMDDALVELDLLGAAPVAGRRPSVLSIGDYRLTALAKAFAHRPALLLCEFPEEGLSRGAIANLRSRLWQAAHDDKACIVLFTENAVLADLAETTLYFR